LSPPPALVRGDLTHSCATHRGCPPTTIHPRRDSSARGDRVCSSRAGYHGGIQFGATTPLWKRAHTERRDTYAEPPASDGPVTAPTRASDYRQLMRDEMPSLPSARAAQARGCDRTCQRIAAHATSRALAVPSTGRAHWTVKISGKSTSRVWMKSDAPASRGVARVFRQ
jgi:hypothetical protein